MVSDPLNEPTTKQLHVTPRGEPTRLGFDQRILLIAFLISLPAVVAAELLLWFGNYSVGLRWTLTLGLALVWLVGSSFLRSRVIRPLQTLSNMVAAIREDDFSFRLRGGGRGDSLADLILEMNTLAGRLQQQQISALEATALLKKVLVEIDVAVFTFDQQRKLRIVNRAGEQLMARISPRMLGLTAAELGLQEFLDVPQPQTLSMAFPGKRGRWAVSHTSFRENGVPHTLLIISDLSRALREEERQAWHRIIRVMGHELNNSLAPIKSIAGTLVSLTGRSTLPEDVILDMKQGLRVIENRVDALNRFMQAYTQLARMPAPSRTKMEVGTMVRRVASLERRLEVKTLEGPPVTIDADPDQLEQVLINLIRNSADASLAPSLQHPGSVEVGWRANGHRVEIFIRDEGLGLLNNDNLFVPFFTTKSGGSGIGLILSRQIVEAHGGVLLLTNRSDRSGCEAMITLPMICGSQLS